METKLEFWHRQTLRDGAARILTDWKEDNASLEQQLTATKAKLDVAVKVMEKIYANCDYDIDAEIEKALETIKEIE